MNKNFILKQYQAIGTVWYIYLQQEIDKLTLTKITQDTINLISEFEQNYSRFIDNSFVSILNSQKTFKNANSEFLQIIELSKKYNKQTNNYFNIAVGGELEKLGYKINFDFTKTGSRKQLPFLSEILNVQNKNIYLDKNYNIDLGGIGKSFLVDKLKKYYQKIGLKKFFINAGGDIYTNFRQPIYIQNPIDTTRYLKSIEVDKKGIATSSPVLRSWKINDKRHHHLINPKNIDTSLKYLSCTVISDNVIDSDIWSKSILLADANIDVKIKDPIIYLVDENYNLITLN